MRFSVIMASRLADYQNSAKFKDQKIARAINSVLNQSFADLELIVIADGCELTKEIVSNDFTDERLELLETEHKALFDNGPRNKGIENAKGEFILYCDIDDYWGTEHLSIINRNLNSLDWVYYNDIILRAGQWVERPCNIRQKGQCGTSNICHANKLNVKWDRPGYSHDYFFLRKLTAFSKHKKIETPEYFVCHMPGGAGYDY
jgi:glycosyltransferase involved in cell wall biosynthesis